ncbi:MAG TPA: response regulator [Candidatus Aquilonibacter sp.]|nr:response regulator [Candidatus Aquilonibacter sp.]
MPEERPENPRPAEKSLRILIADDDQTDVDLCLRHLRKTGVQFEAASVSTRDQFAQHLQSHPVDIVLSDYRMGSWTGMDALATLKQLQPEVPLILMTGTLGDELAVESIKAGVTDYILKGQLARLPMALRRAQEERMLREAEARALVALRESEQHYRTLVQNAPEAIVVLDTEKGRFIDCNDNATKLFQLSREELLTRGPVDVSPPLQPDGAASAIAALEKVNLALQGYTPRFEWVHRNSAGEDIACEVHLVRLASSANHGLVRGSIIDITERKIAEAALRASEARYRSLVNNATYGIYWVALDGKLLFANPALARMLGYDSAEQILAQGDTLSLFCDAAAREMVRAKFFETGRVDAAVDWKRKDGKTIHVRLNGREVAHPENGEQCIEIIVEDITERQNLERQLANAQKFEAIGQLAGGIAHDFNNMVGAILGWADMGLEETEPGSRLHRHFEKVHQQGERAAALTRQLLAFARRQILEPRNMDLNNTVVETLNLLEKVLGSNIEIRANLASDLAVIRADPVQVEQVVMNLCINARDAMPNGGSLILDTSNVAFDERFCAMQPLAHPGNYVMLSVTDSGIGMDAATLDRIFEPFFTTKEVGKGTGLGLATIYGIVRQHNGFVQVYSEVGLGSTFRVYLPAAKVEVDASRVAQAAKPVRGGSETLLVAEDHEGLRHLAVETLSGLGYEVLVACDGEQALAEFERNRSRIGLILLDVVMPKLSGPEVYERICADNPNFPVVFATGYSADISLLKKAQANGLPILQKPYAPRDLARTIRETLDRQSRTLPVATNTPLSR